ANRPSTNGTVFRNAARRRRAHGRYSFRADPAGALIAEPRAALTGRQGTMKIKRIEHIAIAVENVDGMAGILRDKLGIEVEYAENLGAHATRLAMLPVGESYIELLQCLSPSSK